MHRLETIAGVRQRPADDHRHGVVQEGALHLLLDLDDGHPQAVTGRRVRGVWGVSFAGSACHFVHGGASVGGSEVEVADFSGVGDDEVLALLNVVAHEH